jgi:predicted ATPase
MQEEHEKAENPTGSAQFQEGESNSYSFVVPTKGSDEFTAKGNKPDNLENCDAKTVATSTCDDVIATEGTSSGGESFSNYYDQERHRQQGNSGLDWSFLRDGELFDRQEQQRELLDAFDRQMSTSKPADDTEENENDDRRQSTGKRFSSCSFNARTFFKEFVLVSGVSGTGKTILVEETLKRPVMERGGYFLSGKLDQLNKSKSSPQRPYAPFVMAFSNLVESVAKTDVAEDIRKSVCSKMTDRDIDLILDTFPSLARILRPNDTSKGQDGTGSKKKKNGAEKQTQLARVVRTFFETVCDPQKRPIILLIDDLQWADQGTLVLLNSLLSETEEDRNIGLLLVGTCRHNEVTVDDELAMLLRALEDEENVVIRQIEVSNLSRPICGELFARVLGIPRDNYTPELASSLDPLVDIAYDQTKGNAFFLLQFIQILHDEGYLQVQPQQMKVQKQEQANSSSDHVVIDDDHSTNDLSELSFNTGNQKQQSLEFQKSESNSHSQEQASNWKWNEEAIRGSSLHEDNGAKKKDAVSILTHQMKRLPSQVQEALMVASCLGSEFDIDVLHISMPSTTKENFKYSREMLNKSLELLINKKFMKIKTGLRCRFSHDKIQQAAIALIDDKERALFCTNMGRKILQQSGRRKSENIFLIVNFFSHGISEGIITNQSERMMVAKLALEAGESAASMSDFVTAATYLSLGISCLQKKYVGIENGYWEDEYDLTLTIYNAAAEVEYCTANFERMEALIREILLNAREFHDKMRAYSTMIVSLGSRERLLEAIAQGFSLLEVLGERFQTKDLKVFLLFDLIKTKKMLKNFVADFERAPIMKDKDKLAAMEILNLIFPYCTMLKHPKGPHAIFRMVQLSVKYGITATSATGFAGYGMGLCGIGDFRNGNRYGKLALRLVDHFEAKHLMCRVFCIYYGFVSHWNRVRESNSLSFVFAILRDLLSSCL